jgi:uncharacterized protein YcfJ
MKRIAGSVVSLVVGGAACEQVGRPRSRPVIVALR